MDAPLLELDRISRRVSSQFALEEISLTLHPGEVHVIVGENGSGKSTLMRIAAGLDAPDGGAMRLGGAELRLADIADARRLGIIYQHQDPELFENLSVAENIFFSHMHRRGWFKLTFDSNSLYRRCGALFRHLKVDLAPTTPVNRLGYAQKLLVTACATFIAKGRVVIFDEPTAGMADQERAVFFRIIQGLRARNVGVFYISHKLDEIPMIGTRVTVLQHGRIAGQLMPAFSERSAVIRMMTGQTGPERYPRIAVDAGPEVLAVEHLSSGTVLKDVSFSLRRGEILGLTGLAGSGRTRLANCLYGLTKPDGGTVRLDGEEVRFQHPADALKKGLAMIPEDRVRNAVFQHQDIESNMTAVALERFKARLGLDTHYMEELSGEYLDSLGIFPTRLSSMIDRCSGGNQQKIVIGRWLMSLAHVFIMDEPTRGIDAAARVDIYNAMNDMVSKGVSILLISSETEELLGMCDRILILAGGAIVHELPRSSATKECILEYASRD